MRILLIGGTRFVGRAMAEAALAAGHEVTVLHRGQTGRQALADAEHLLADRDQDLSALAGRTFDATIDVCAYVPRQVETLAKALGDRGGHHVYISTMSVYADTDAPGLDENSPLTATPDPSVETVTGETYGGLKVLCEQAAVAAYGEVNVTIVRPTYVVGPEDYTFRFPRWVHRIAAGGEVLAPGPKSSPMSVVDARDQGAWTVRLAETRTAGAFNGIGTALPFGFDDMLDATVDAVGPDGTTLTWVDGGWLVEHGVDGRALPLWNEGKDEWTLAGDNSRALATGLTPRPLRDTVADTLDWMRRIDAELPDSWGLSAEREAELLTEWRASQASN
jgi:nucleoside-diphosphate-sugar epimerase